jgi:peptidoglycan hydrolase-like protein with peptidoglycan-binding domain
MQLKQLAIAVAAAFVVAAPAFAAGDPRGPSAQDTMSKSSEQSAHVQSSSAVREAQQALKDKGFDTGPIDGVMGPKTSAALKEFQESQGLKTTGQLDAQTRSALDVQATGMQSSTTGRPSGSMSGPTRSSDATSPSPSSTQSGKTTSPSPTQSSGATAPSSGQPMPSRPGDAASRSSDATSPSPSSTQSGKTDPAARPGG